MRYNPKIQHRKSIRMRGYNYSQAGLYFITICVRYRKCLFGDIIVGAPLVGAPGNSPELKLNDAGRMVENEWLKMPQRFPNIKLHEFVVMPNHFHAILEIVVGATVGATLVVAPPAVAKATTGAITGETTGATTRVAPTVGEMVGVFKSIVTVEYIRGVKNMGWKQFNGKLWQRNYWEHIIHDDQSYKRISEYIIKNPQKWNYDKLKG